MSNFANYNIHNPTKAPRVIHTLDSQAPVEKDKDGKVVVNPLRSHKQIKIDPGQTLENIELDDGLVARLKAQAKTAGHGQELELQEVRDGSKSSKAA